jgi:hypothetical protein
MNHNIEKLRSGYVSQLLLSNFLSEDLLPSTSRLRCCAKAEYPEPALVADTRAALDRIEDIES